MQTHELETERNVLVEHEIKKMCSGVAVLTILYCGRNSKTTLRFLYRLVWISTLRMNFNFKDPYCQRVFMLEAEEAARHLDWMKLVLGGAKIVVSSNGFYDGRNLPTGYIVAVPTLS